MTKIVYGIQDVLLENLGERDAVELLAGILPLINERKIALQQYLHAEDWEAAARIAHKTISSVRLYGSAELETLLQQVRQQELVTIATPAFQAKLEATFSDTMQTLIDWLAEHPASTQ